MEIPKLTHIWYLNLKDDQNKNASSIVNQLEEAWIELDSIIGKRNSWSRTIINGKELLCILKI